jgi:hypothetical protein
VEHVVLGTARLSGARYVLLVYHDSDNSLPAALEVAPALREFCGVGLAHIGTAGSRVGQLVRAAQGPLQDPRSGGPGTRGAVTVASLLLRS